MKLLDALAPANQWDVAYPVVSHAAQSFLDANAGTSYSTAELGQSLLPAKIEKPTPEYRAARQRLFKALRAAATHGLAGYVTSVETRSPWNGKPCQSLRWAAPIGVEDL